MNSSFYNGISGVKTHQFGLDVWANNISNISTTGFRASTPEFSSLFATTLAGSLTDTLSSDKGLGSQSQTTALSMQQGILENSDNPFDLAIDGEGWFGIKGQTSEIYYTRAGQFSPDTNGHLVDSAGNYLLGFSANNLTPAELSEEKLNKFGQYYKSTGQTSVNPYAITMVPDVSFNSQSIQSQITLPEYLYFPPEATANVDYQANLDPKIIEQTTNIETNESNAISLSMNYPSATISGTLANNTNLTDLKEGDTILLTLIDGTNATMEVEATVDANFNFSASNIDISNLENGSISVISTAKVVQEIPNVEHFTTELITPDGEKDILDMTFTKRVPQQPLETTWDADIKILRYFEPYVIERWDPNVTYDETLYTIDTEAGTVTKIYDPTLYEVNLGEKKVYQIMDSGEGTALFGGGGELLSAQLPTLLNGTTPLNINIGDPYQREDVSITSSNLSDGNFLISGAITTLVTEGEGIQAGDNVMVQMTSPEGRTFTASAKIADDGTWTALYEDFPADIDTTTLSLEAYVVLESGYEGMISHVDLDKARVSTKDGYVEGFLENYGMDENGNIMAEFSNGRSSAVAKVALYHFQNDEGLLQLTSTLFGASSNSGEAFFYADADGNGFLNSRIRSNYLERSNVNFATALTELIIMQKAFDASAKSITTSDQLIQNAINMKK